MDDCHRNDESPTGAAVVDPFFWSLVMPKYRTSDSIRCYGDRDMERRAKEYAQKLSAIVEKK
jgi:hypothetical protein